MIRLMMLAVFAGFFALCGCASLHLGPARTAAAEESGRYVVYVSHGGDKVSMFTMNRETGELTYDSSVVVGKNPGALAVDPQRQRLYAAIRTSSSVAALKIDAATGRLSNIAVTEVGFNPVYLATDSTGRYLLSSSYGSDEAASFRIESDGSVAAGAVSSHATPRNPHSIYLDAADRTAYVPCTGADRILQFRFDRTSGKLTPHRRKEIVTATGAGPRHMAFHPTGKFIYVCGEKDSTITAYYIEADGSLLEVHRLSTLPEDFAGKNTTADVHVTPDGRFVYVSNRGHDSLAGYAIDQKTGRLVSLGQFATERTPREFDIDPTGRFVYAAGQGSGKLAAYRLDGATGLLHRIGTYEAAESPSWVLVMRLPD